MPTPRTHTRPGTLTRLSGAETATRARPRTPADGEWLLQPGDVVVSPETKLAYRVEHPLGRGGFGQAFLAHRLGRSTRVPAQVCLKVSRVAEGWLREAYFGQVLGHLERAIRVYDAFPRFLDGERVLYCLALELAAEGDLRAYLERTRKPWTEAAVRREIAGLLQVLGRLHRGQLLHRDLTPMNVFVCEGRRLKLGDFGIVRQQSDGRGVPARTLNAITAPTEILDGGAPQWQARDDVYQVGQLLGMLVRGHAQTRLALADIRHLPCSDHLKEVIYRCLGERRKRYQAADELITALTRPPTALRRALLRTLKGVHLAFTGILSRPRKEAAAAARKAGAVVHGMPSLVTRVIVRGKPNALQAAGREGGRKLLEIKRLQEQGHTVTVLEEARFWALVERARIPSSRPDTRPRARPRT